MHSVTTKIDRIYTYLSRQMLKTKQGAEMVSATFTDHLAAIL